ncbi:MAG: hypothetical protein OEU95_00055, partial [Nitrospirota bacterium]|nr:hypothetical protein [Nitrospirota bacterium]
PFDPVTFSWDRAQILYLALYCLILSVPFFFAGALIATAFLLYSERSASVYGSDLLGAGAGSLAVLLILDRTGAENAVLTASTICLAGALLTAGRRIRMLSVAFILFNLLLFFVHPAFIDVRVSPYKELPLYLKHPGAEHLDTFHSSYSRIDTFKSPAIRSAPGLSLKYAGQLPEQTGLAVDGDSVDVITGAGDRAGLRFLEFMPSSLPYITGAKDDVLILDPKGGLHALMAEYSGSVNIHKVESNPMVVKVVRDNFREFSGKIFDKDTWTGYGRSFLHGQRSYDIIDLSVTGASVSRAFGVSEDYRYTVEAFKKYLAALKEDGTLSVSLYLIPPPRTEFRILATIIRAMEESGIRDIGNKLAAIRSWDSITILTGRSDLNKDKIRMIRSFAESRRFDAVYYPGITEEETNQYVRMPSNEYYKGFKELIGPQTRQLFIRDYLFDISPVYDENPFFHYYFRLGNIERIYGVMGQKWIYFMQEGYLMPVMLAIMLLLSIVLILLPVLFRRRTEHSVRSGHFRLFAFLYFAMLGLGSCSRKFH